MSPEDADAWKNMNEQHGDNFKAAADANLLRDIKNLLDSNVKRTLENGNSWSGEYKGFKLWIGEPGGSRSKQYEIEVRDSRNHAVQNRVRSFSALANTIAAAIEHLEKGVLSIDQRYLREMEELLEKRGYDPKDAKTLQDEGMGPYELEYTLKFQPGSVGSLEYTHGFKKVKTALVDQWKAFA